MGAAPRLLVTAGSNGAQVFNETMPLIVARLLEDVAGLTIVHQAGARQLEKTRAAYAASGADPARWAVEAFLTDMPAQYAAADVVLGAVGEYGGGVVLRRASRRCWCRLRGLRMIISGRMRRCWWRRGRRRCCCRRMLRRRRCWTALVGLLTDGPRRDVDGGEGACAGAAGSAGANCGDGVAAGGGQWLVASEWTKKKG